MWLKWPSNNRVGVNAAISVGMANGRALVPKDLKLIVGAGFVIAAGVVSALLCPTIVPSLWRDSALGR